MQISRTDSSAGFLPLSDFCDSSCLLSELQLNPDNNVKLSFFLSSWQHGSIKVLKNGSPLSYNEIFQSVDDRELLNNARSHKVLNHYLELWRDHEVSVSDEYNSLPSLYSYFNLLPQMGDIDSSFDAQTVNSSFGFDPFANFIGKPSIEERNLSHFYPSIMRYNSMLIEDPVEPEPTQTDSIESESEGMSSFNKDFKEQLYEAMKDPILFLQDALSPHFIDNIPGKNCPLECVEMRERENGEQDSDIFSSLPTEILQHVFSFCPLSDIKSLSLIKPFRDAILDRHFKNHYRLNLETHLAQQWEKMSYRTQKISLPEDVIDPEIHWFGEKLVVRSDYDFYIYEARFLEKGSIKVSFPYQIIDFRRLKKNSFMIAFSREMENYLMIFHPTSEQEVKIFRYDRYRVLNSSQIALFTEDTLKLVNIRSKKIQILKHYFQRVDSITTCFTIAMSRTLLAISLAKAKKLSVFDMSKKKEINMKFPGKQATIHFCSIDKNSLLAQRGAKIYQFSVNNGKETTEKEYDLTDFFKDRTLLNNGRKKRDSIQPGNFILNKKTKKGYLLASSPLTLAQIDLNMKGSQAFSYGYPKESQKYSAGNVSAFVGPLLLNFSDGLAAGYIHMWNLKESNVPEYKGAIIKGTARKMQLNKGKSMLAFTLKKKDKTYVLSILDFLPESKLGIHI
jgi:hypothetical protein